VRNASQRSERAQTTVSPDYPDYPDYDEQLALESSRLTQIISKNRDILNQPLLPFEQSTESKIIEETSPGMEQKGFDSLSNIYQQTFQIKRAGRGKQESALIDAGNGTHAICSPANKTPEAN
jgi:hypothetical protein